MDQKALPLETLVKIDKKALIALWEEVFGSPPAFTGSQEFLRHIIAQEMQGGITSSLRKKLDRLKVNDRKLKSGTCIIKEWHGKKYSVAVLDEGFEFDGQTYPSLTKIAKKITGTAWNGPAFFGLRR